MASCIYCDREEYGPGVTVKLCQRHLELRAIAWVLERKGLEVTTKNVREYLDLVSDPVAIQPGEVPALLRQMRSRPKNLPRKLNKDKEGVDGNNG